MVLNTNAMNVGFLTSWRKCPKISQLEKVSIDSSPEDCKNGADCKRMVDHATTEFHSDVDESENGIFAFEQDSLYQSKWKNLCSGSSKELNQKYKIYWGRCVGTGGSARVYQGERISDGMFVAIKQVRIEKHSQFKEIEFLKQLDHKNINKMHDVYMDKDALYVVLEYISGGDLFNTIENVGSFCEYEGKRFLKQMCEALNYLENKNIVHRDIKVENIMYCKNAKAFKLIDFGLAQYISDKPRIVGTIGYLAPEILSGKSATVKADIFSLGICLYILLAGYHPFDPYAQNSINETNSAILNSKWDFNDPVWRHISFQVKDLIRNMLHKDPEKRYNISQILNHPWIKKNQTNLINRKEFISKYKKQVSI